MKFNAVNDDEHIGEIELDKSEALAFIEFISKQLTDGETIITIPIFNDEQD